MPRRINVTSRGLRTEFEQSINGDIVRALVEVVTNANDSYTRAGTDGPIYIQFAKLRRNIYPVSVTDNAEGMSEKDMSLAADVGVETSGFAGKKTIRGLLGRGLKQAAFGIGIGVDMEAIKGGLLNAARLSCFFSRSLSCCSNPSMCGSAALISAFVNLWPGLNPCRWRLISLMAPAAFSSLRMSTM